MSNFTWSETFISLEGEFLFQGCPTLYIRFSGCNFTCQGFNNPDNLELTNEVLGFNPKDIKNIKEMPLITKGCDSLYAHDKRFKHLWHKGDENDLANEVFQLLPKQMQENNSWNHPVTQQPYILSLTGGDPILNWKKIPTLLNHPLFDTLQLVLIENNCSIKFDVQFIQQLNEWIDKLPGRKIIWANSPKLTASGEPFSKAIIPEIAKMQRLTKNYIQYFKFVAGPRIADFDEIDYVSSLYRNCICDKIIIGVMPEACTADQQNEIAKQVAEMCIQRGYIYVARLQNYLWSNEVGT